MIIEKQKEAVVIEEGMPSESIAMSLDLDSAQILMQMLSKNLYSDSIGSTIRECASNALDSHRRAGVTEPIVVSLLSERNGYEFSVEDFGVGLDDNDVKHIISKYGKSTKRNSNTELGMMGLGFKAPLAYSSSFYFICRKDGMERKYMMYEGEDTNTIDLLYENTTTERSGVKVIVPVKNGDYNNFRSKIKEQLAYFENVYINCFDVKNDFKIFKHEHFQYSELNHSDDLHLCLDNVYYPLDFQKLGIDTIQFPVAIRFSLTDGIFPTPNRESIRYTQEAITAIKNKIKIVADYFVKKYNDSITETEDIIAVLQSFSTSDHYIDSFFGSGKLQIDDFLPFATIPLNKPKIKGLNVLTSSDIWHMADNLLAGYQRKYQYSYKRFYKDEYAIQGHFLLHYSDKTYVYNSNLSNLKKDYIRHIKGNIGSIYFIKKSFDIPLGKPLSKMIVDRYTYYNILRLKQHPVSTWRDRIKDFQRVRELIISKFHNVDDIIIPQEFINSRKKVKDTSLSKKAESGELNTKLLVNLDRYSEGKNSKLMHDVVKLAHIPITPKLTIYGVREDFDKIDYLYPLIKNCNFRILTIKDCEVIKKSNFHNWIEINKFMEGDNIVFKRLATAFVIDNLKEKYKNVFNNIQFIEKISTELCSEMSSLKNYYDDNYLRVPSPEVRQSILEIADKHGYYDLSIYSTCKIVETKLNKLYFLNVLMENLRYSNIDSMVKPTVELCKYHKFRVNLSHYQAEQVVAPEETVVVSEEAEHVDELI